MFSLPIVDLERSAPDSICVDDVLLDDWHIVGERELLGAHPSFKTKLLGIPLNITADETGLFNVIRADNGAKVVSKEKWGFVWACVGTPSRDIIHFPETDEADRFNVRGGSIAVKTSGLRAVENFLDMGHFPFVHAGWLGAEPHTEVAPYSTEITDNDEVLATECKFFQPVTSPGATGGMMVDYIYKVFRPYTVALYKTNAVQTHRQDVIVLFLQPVDQDNCIAHSLLSFPQEGFTEASIRWFMQLIFGQDKPILENHVPKRLPLDPRAETPIRADASSIMFRRWLRDRNVTYGAIPALT